MALLQGTYFAPNSARRIEAAVELAGAGRLRLRTPAEEREWTLDQVQFSPALGGLPCSIAFADGSRFETPDDPAIAAWLQESGQQRAGSVLHRLERHWKAAAIAAVSVTVGIALFLWLGLPACAGWIAVRVPDRVRVEVGRQTRLLLEALLDDAVDTDADKIAEIEREFEALLEVRAIPGPRPHVVIRSGKGIGPNALAIPDGTVIVTEEMIQLVPDTAALTGVLAHELGHLYHSHGMAHLIRASSIPFLVVLVTGDLGSGTSLVGTIPINLIHNGYGREAEREADRFAVELMRARGLDPSALADMFTLLGDKYGDLPGWLSTHPATDERVRFFREAAISGSR